MTPSKPPPPAPTLVYSARYYDMRPQVRSHYHLYEYHIGQKTNRGRQLTFGNGEDDTVTPAPNGRDIYFVRTGPSNADAPRVCCLNLLTGVVRTVFVGTKGTYLTELSAAPNNTHLIVRQTYYKPKYLKKSYMVTAAGVVMAQYLVATNGNLSQKRRLWHSEAAPVISPIDWLPNGDLLVEVASNRKNKTGSQISLLRSADNYHVFRPLFRLPSGNPTYELSPNRQRLLVVRYEKETYGGSTIGAIAGASNDVSVESFGGGPYSEFDNEETVPALILRVPDGKQVAHFTRNAFDSVGWLSDEWIGTHNETGRHKDDSPPIIRIVSAVTGQVVFNKPVTIVPDAEGNRYDFMYSEGRIGISSVSKRKDVLVVGVSGDKGSMGAQYLMSLKTGKARFWYEAGFPYGSPNEGGYFTAYPYHRVDTVVTRPNGMEMQEYRQDLYVGRWNERNKKRVLYPVVLQAAAQDSAWLPIVKKKMTKP